MLCLIIFCAHCDEQDTSCQGSNDDWMSRQLELERMRVLLKEKDVIIKVGMLVLGFLKIHR